MDHPASHDDGVRSRPGLRRTFASLHARTWELELFISGAVAFGLSRLPGTLDRAFFTLEPGLPRDMRQFAFLAYYYLALILYTLIGTFVLHLVSRAFWVGMVGLDSVFPRGIRWGALKQGPITRSFYRANLPSVKRLIRTGDAVSSVMFAIGWAVVGIFVGSILSVVVVGVPVIVAGRLLFGGVDVDLMMTLIILGIVVPSTGAALVDKAWGRRLDPGGWPARLIRGMLAIGYWGLLVPLHGAVSLTLSSNLDRKAVGVATAMVMALLVSAFMINTFWQQGLVVVHGSPYLPTVPGASSVAVRHYESARDGPVPPVPTIQDDIVDAPYVRLFIPWDASRDEREMERACPGLPRISRTGLRLLRSRTPPASEEETARLLECAGRLWGVTLDGEPARGPDFVFYENPSTGVPGVALYLPTEGLAKGRHLLLIERRDLAPENPPEPGDEPREPRRWRIPFWI